MDHIEPPISEDEYPAAVHHGGSQDVPQRKVSRELRSLVEPVF